MPTSVNDKSLVGPVEAETTKQVKETRIIHIQPKEVSIPLEIENPEITIPIESESTETSVPILFESPETSVPIEFEKPDFSVPIEYEKPDVSVPIDYEKPDVSVPIDYEKPDISVPLEYEKPDISLPLEYEKPDISVPLFFEQLSIIRLFSSARLGHNTYYPKDTVSVHEAVNINSSNIKDGLKVIPGIETSVYNEEGIDALDIAVIDSSFTEHYMDFISIVLYEYYASGSDSKNRINKFEVLRDLEGLYETSSTLYFPVVPIPFGWKRETDEHAANHPAAFASNPILIPLLKEVSTTTYAMPVFIYKNNYSFSNKYIYIYSTEAQLLTFKNNVAGKGIKIPNVNTSEYITYTCGTPTSHTETETTPEYSDSDVQLIKTGTPSVIIDTNVYGDGAFIYNLMNNAENYDPTTIYTLQVNATYHTFKVANVSDITVDGDGIVTVITTDETWTADSLHHCTTSIAAEMHIYKMLMSSGLISISNYSNVVGPVTYLSNLVLSSDAITEDLQGSGNDKNITSTQVQLSSSETVNGNLSIRDKIAIPGSSSGDDSNATGDFIPKHWWGNGATWGYRTIRGLKVDNLTIDAGLYPRGCLLFELRLNNTKDERMDVYSILIKSGTLDLHYTSSLYDYPIIGINILFIADYNTITATNGWDNLYDLTQLMSSQNIAYSCSMATSQLYNGNNSVAADFTEQTVLATNLLSKLQSGMYKFSISGLRVYPYYNGFNPNYLFDPSIYKCTGLTLNNGVYGGPDLETGDFKEYFKEYNGINSLTIEAPPVSVQFNLGFINDKNWKRTNASGLLTENIIGKISIYTSAPDLPYYDSVFKMYQTQSYFDDKIYDPAIATSKLSNVMSCRLHDNGNCYNYREIMNGVATAEYQDEDPTHGGITIRSAIGLITNSAVNLSDDIVYDITIPSDLTITNRSINVLISLSNTYALTETCVTTDAGTYYYYGIINKTEASNGSFRHYSPINLLKDINVITSSARQDIGSIKILKSSDDYIAVIVTSGAKEFYIVLSQVSATRGSVFLPDEQKELFILQTFVKENNLVKNPTLQYNDTGLNEFGLCDEWNMTKRIRLIEYDDFLGMISNYSIETEFNNSTVLSLCSSYLLANSVCAIDDATDYAVTSIPIPLLYPTMGIGLSSPDIIAHGGAVVTTSEITKILSRYYYNQYIMVQDHSKHIFADMNTSYQNLIVISMPGVDSDTKTYKSLPEKLNNFLDIEKIQLLSFNGNNSLSINKRNYVVLGSNIYEASRIKLIKSNNTPLLDGYGEVYSLSNYIFTASDDTTFIYAMTDFGIAMITSIPDKLLTTPIKIGESVVMVCTKGIYTVADEMIYEFGVIAESAKIKAVGGRGYLIAIKYTDESVGAVSLYQITNDMSISSLNIPTLTAEALGLMTLVSDNLLSNKLQLIDYDAYASTGGKAVVLTNVIDYDDDTVASNTSLTTCPLFIKGQEGDTVFVLHDIIIDFYGTDTDITLYIIRDGATSDPYTGTTTNIDGDMIQQRFELGYMKLDGVRLKLVIAPTTNDFKLINIRGVGSYEENGYLLET